MISLSKRAVDKAWIPPEGFSGLPLYMKNNIPEEYKYWLKADKKHRINLRNRFLESVREENNV